MQHGNFSRLTLLFVYFGDFWLCTRSFDHYYNFRFTILHIRIQCTITYSAQHCFRWPLWW